MIDIFDITRYVGKDYSGAQEVMEDEMKEYYKKSNTEMLLRSLAAKQLVAANAEEETWLRGEVVSIEQEQAKVYYVDYGFSEVIEKKKLRKLSSQFYSLPFQATKCKLAGLEAFCDNPAVVKEFETVACGKILLVEILERSAIPLVVLYDTSGDEDVNINAACLKAIQDKSLEVNVKVNSCHTYVKVTCVSSSGTIYCQIPSKGLKKLTETLERVDQYFISRPVTSDQFLSVPFCGKWCLLFHEGKWVRVEITSIHSSRAIDVQLLDSGAVASVKVSDVREIPFLFLRELIEIPPQAVKCCLADLPFPIGMWTPNAILWLRETVMNTSDCSLKVMKVEDSKKLVHIYLFSPKSYPNADRSINQQLSNADLWTHQKDVYLSSDSSTISINSKNVSCSTTVLQEEISKKDLNSTVIVSLVEYTNATGIPEIPPTFPLPKPGEQIDVYVSVACHPGHFVLQPWQELHRLEVLMEDMILHYNTREEKPVPLEKNKIYAAKVDKKWHRVLVKGLLTNGLVSVYQLDYGRHELVSYENIRPLIGKFRLLPFQAITAQLAGVDRGHWSEEASILFRNNVENKPLVAVVQEIHEGQTFWDRKIVTFLVDTSLPDTDVWIHDLVCEYIVGISAS
ncbi:tudor domain-containing protein 7 [Protopterus annectens]|uniref:tudor domain-containing protein 7 n=1 Tax=Protopterus annectens TaxID=7888 RepID=UPI001CFA2022|nr:tudor domain-containing protein 7 [Protopterus annectens]